MTKKRWALVEKELPLVRAIAARTARQLPLSVDLEDLVSVGTMALISLVERFDPKRGELGAYARLRIRGAMLDWMRRGNYQFELHDELYDDYTDEHAPEDQPTVVAMDTRPGPEDVAGSRQVVELIRGALGTLTAEERYAILARAEGESFEAIGAHFDHSTSWAFDLARRARQKVQRTLAMHRLNAA